MAEPVPAENAAGGNRAYTGTVPVTMLKVIGVELVSVGRIDADEAAGERVDVLEDADALRWTGAPAETVLAPA